jgi:hypothetical protein
VALALMGDVIVAATDAYFLAPFAKLCLAPDSGVSFLLTRALGRTGAMNMLLLGQRLSAGPSKARWARISTFGAGFRANCRARPIAWRASPPSGNGARHASWAANDKPHAWPGR